MLFHLLPKSEIVECQIKIRNMEPASVCLETCDCDPEIEEVKARWKTLERDCEDNLESGQKTLAKADEVLQKLAQNDCGNHTTQDTILLQQTSSLIKRTDQDLETRRGELDEQTKMVSGLIKSMTEDESNANCFPVTNFGNLTSCRCRLLDRCVIVTVAVTIIVIILLILMVWLIAQ